MSLKGLTVHVPKRVDGDLSVQSAVISKLQALGATCAKRLSREVTHVVFLRKLLPSAAEQAQQTAALKELYDRLIKIQPHAYVVSNLWVHSTAELGRKADEASFIIPRPEEPAAPRFYALGTDDPKGRKRSSVTPKRAGASSVPLPVDAFSFNVDDILYSSSQQLHHTPIPTLAQRLAQRNKENQERQPAAAGISPLGAPRSARKRRASAPLDTQPIKAIKRQAASTSGAAPPLSTTHQPAHHTCGTSPSLQAASPLLQHVTTLPHQAQQNMATAGTGVNVTAAVPLPAREPQQPPLTPTFIDWSFTPTHTTLAATSTPNTTLAATSTPTTTPAAAGAAGVLLQQPGVQQPGVQQPGVQQQGGQLQGVPAGLPSHRGKHTVHWADLSPAGCGPSPMDPAGCSPAVLGPAGCGLSPLGPAGYTPSTLGLGASSNQQPGLQCDAAIGGQSPFSTPQGTPLPATLTPITSAAASPLHFVDQAEIDTVCVPAQHNCTTPATGGNRSSQRLRSKAGAQPVPRSPLGQFAPPVSSAAATGAAGVLGLSRQGAGVLGFSGQGAAGIAASPTSVGATPGSDVCVLESPGCTWVCPTDHAGRGGRVVGGVVGAATQAVWGAAGVVGASDGGANTGQAHTPALPSLGGQHRLTTPGSSTPTLILKTAAGGGGGAVPMSAPTSARGDDRTRGGRHVSAHSLVDKAFTFKAGLASPAVGPEPGLQHVPGWQGKGSASEPRSKVGAPGPRAMVEAAAASPSLGCSTSGAKAGGQEGAVEAVVAGASGIVGAAKQLLARKRRQAGGSTPPTLRPSLRAPALISSASHNAISQLGQSQSPCVALASAASQTGSGSLAVAGCLPQTAPAAPSHLTPSAPAHPTPAAPSHLTPAHPTCHHVAHDPQPTAGAAHPGAVMYPTAVHPDAVVCSPAEVLPLPPGGSEAEEVCGVTAASTSAARGDPCDQIILLEDGTMVLEPRQHVTLEPQQHVVGLEPEQHVVLEPQHQGVYPVVPQPAVGGGNKCNQSVASSDHILGVGQEQSGVSGAAVQQRVAVQAVGSTAVLPRGQAQGGAGRRYKQMQLCVPRLKGQAGTQPGG